MAPATGRFEVMVTNVTVPTHALEPTPIEGSQNPVGRGWASPVPPAQLDLANERGRAGVVEPHGGTGFPRSRSAPRGTRRMVAWVAEAGWTCRSVRSLS